MLARRDGESSGPVIMTGIGVGGVAACICKPPVDDAKLEPEAEVRELLESSRYPGNVPVLTCSKIKINSLSMHHSGNKQNSRL